MRFDLLSLRLFVSVCEHLSIARAAEAHHIAASAVSKRMSDLENMLKAPLFFRGPKGLDLTDTALALLHHARILLRDLSQMEAELGDHRKGVRGKVRIAASVSTIVQHLPGDLARFLAQHGGVGIELEEGISQDIVRAVADNAADIGVFGGNLPTPGLTVLPYRNDRLIVLMRSEHPLAGAGKATFAQIAEHDLVGPQKGSFLDSLFLRAVGNLSQPARLRIRVNGFETAASMVEAGLGIALVPENLAARYVAGGALTAVQLDEDWATREWKLCTRNVDTLPPPAQLLVQHLAPDAFDAAKRLRRRA
jgi:DNA-binding transcriptional LysR family regulator